MKEAKDMNKRFAINFLLVFVVIGTASQRSSAQEWMQFRGPNGTGVSNATNLPTEFGPDKAVIWKTPLPAGHSSPVFGRDRIFVTGFEGNKLFTIGLERQTGKLLWKKEVPRPRTD